MARSHYQAFGWLCLGLASLNFSFNVLALDEPINDVSTGSLSIASRILAISDVVLQNHIDPPTRQQMILASIKAVYRAKKLPIPVGLSERVSQMSESEEFTACLQEHLDEFAKVSGLESILTRGLLECVPGSATLTDEDSNRIQAQLAANRYVGIGVMLSMNADRNLPQIPKAFYNGPASRAGVKSDDLILEIDGKSTDSKDLNQIVQELRGEDGTEVTLVVGGVDSTETRNLTMTRGRVFIPTVTGITEKSEGEWEYRIGPENDFALLVVNSIGPSTLHELKQIEAKLQAEGIQGIIIDLRTGGGTLHDTVMVADSFMEAGVIGHIRYLDRIVEHKAQPGSLFQDIPMAVLVGGRTSSGSVFLTAALQDSQRAVVIGEPTGGQTYVRTLLAIPGRSEKITLAVAEMLRADGTLLLTTDRSQPEVESFGMQDPTSQQRPGNVVPDQLLNVTRQSENLEPIDPAVATAVEVLRARPPT